MKSLYKNYLFDKHILVSENSIDNTVAASENQFEVLFSIANLFNIRIVKGEKLVSKDMIKFIESRLGTNVPEPFYRGFPESVRQLSPDQLLFDQLVHYTMTYGFGYFSEAGHSLFESQFERIAFKEETPIKDFSVLTEEEAVLAIGESVNALLMSSRPLSTQQYELIRTAIVDYDISIQDIASKNTTVKLLNDLRDFRFTDFLSLSDVIKLVEELNYSEYQNDNIKKLNLRNYDRKFIAAVIDKLFESGRVDIRTCFEKKKLWNGLLHHIHYRARSKTAQAFLDAMRGNENLSVFSEFERAMTDKNIKVAVDKLKSGKGSGAVLRNLNYMISRCENEEDINYILDAMDTKNVIILLQLLIQYSQYRYDNSSRIFTFTRFNMMKVHNETSEEIQKRKSLISEKQAELIVERLEANLISVLKNRLGKVYIDPDMKNYALPLQETTSQGGFGVLTRGSRLRIPEGKKIRAFTYWEKVDDIDLSVFGIDENGHRVEYSWRTMSSKQSDVITYSGDVTNGYHGGSEYFDIDVEKFKKLHPDKRFLIFCDNVYSMGTFQSCLCKAGYMLRDVKDSGEIYEPKTVNTSFQVNVDSSFAYLFGIDLTKMEFVWLNTGMNRNTSVAGTQDMSFILDYFGITDVMNMKQFFEMMASEVVDDISKAEVVVTDKSVEVAEGVQLIREYDFDKMLAIMNR